MSEPTLDDLWVERQMDSDGDTLRAGHRPLTPAEFDRIATEQGYVKREEARRWVDGMAEVADRYKRERDLARLHQETTEASYRRQIEYMEKTWVKRPVCGECEGDGKRAKQKSWSSGMMDPFDPCPSCGGSGFGRLVALDGIDVEAIEDALADIANGLHLSDDQLTRLVSLASTVLAIRREVAELGGDTR